MLEAFEAVKSHFERGPDGGWRHRQTVAAGLDFDAQLERAPVEQAFDKAVLASMALEVALADGHTARSEEQVLQRHVETLRARVPLEWRKELSARDLSETTPGPTRDTMLMLAWAVALVDEQLDPRELERLERFARALLIPRKRVRELRECVRSRAEKLGLGP